MPIYNYKARDKSGEEISGSIEADSLDAVAENLLREKLSILEITVKPDNFYDPLIEKFFSGRVPAKELVIFFRQVSVMLEANLPLVKVLTILSDQIENKAFKNVVISMAEEVDGGSSFSAAMSMHPKIFSGFYVNIIRSGETSGRMAEVMTYLADQREKDYEMQSRVKSAWFIRFLF